MEVKTAKDTGIENTAGGHEIRGERYRGHRNARLGFMEDQDKEEDQDTTTENTCMEDTLQYKNTGLEDIERDEISRVKSGYTVEELGVQKVWRTQIQRTKIQRTQEQRTQVGKGIDDQLQIRQLYRKCIDLYKSAYRGQIHVTINDTCKKGVGKKDMEIWNNHAILFLQIKLNYLSNIGFDIE